MTLTDPYGWLIFLHVGSALLFGFVHGAHVVVMWKKRNEPDPVRNQALFDSLPSSNWWLRSTALAIIATGLLLVVQLNLWTRLWIWLSLATLGAIWLAMWRWGGGYYGLVSEASGNAISAIGTDREPATMAELERARMSWHTPAMTIVGFGGMAAVLWLMIFKPF